MSSVLFRSFSFAIAGRWKEKKTANGRTDQSVTDGREWGLQGQQNKRGIVPASRYDELILQLRCAKAKEMVTGLWVQETDYLVLWKVFEIDTGVYLVHTRNKRSPLNSGFEYVQDEFYISFQDGRWLTYPQQPIDLVKETGAAIRAAGYQ